MSISSTILVIAICYLPVMVIFAILPYIGRRTLTFGVSIPSKEYENTDLAQMRKSFAVGVVLTGLIFTIITVVLYASLQVNLATSLTTTLIFAYIIAIGIMYVRRNKAVKQIKAQQGWADSAHATVVADTNFASTKRAVSALWFVLYIVIIVSTLLLGILLYDQIPDHVPMQTDFEGNVTRVVDKTFGVILFGPVLQAVMAILFGFVYWMMQRTPAVIDPDRPKESSMQNTKFRYRWSAFIVFGGLLMLLIFLFMQLVFAEVIPRDLEVYVPLIAAGALVIAAIALSISTGQSGSRIRVGKKTDGGIIRRDDDKYWRGGMIYVNKDDPALFVEKRFGIGFTLNFGRPGAIAIMIGFIVFIAAIVIISATLTS